jgi:hypothetical protein
MTQTTKPQTFNETADPFANVGARVAIGSDTGTITDVAFVGDCYDGLAIIYVVEIGTELYRLRDHALRAA